MASFLSTRLITFQFRQSKLHAIKSILIKLIVHFAFRTKVKDLKSMFDAPQSLLHFRCTFSTCKGRKKENYPLFSRVVARSAHHVREKLWK